jgi:hypothetical protein
MIKLDEYLNEKQQKHLWDLLEEFQEDLHGTKGVGAMLCRRTFY